ncbi:MAG: hypothetical protein GVY25_01380 [Bacteroidetes bacterium]|jgi:transposase|nr:hypothetical protein [Bacteroidota bacterium]
MATPSSSGTESLTVQLPPPYAEWIRRQAKRHDVTAARVIQQLVDNQRRRDTDRSTPDALDESEESVADNLRSASKRLRDLVDRAESLDEDSGDVINRIESRLKDQIDDTDTRGEDAGDDAQSMFDMMDE